MIVDTSAIIAVLQREDPHVEPVLAALSADRGPSIAAPSVVECLIVLSNRHGPVARTAFDRLKAEINLTVVDFTADHALAAHRAYLQYGKGRHPAALNFGDTMAYAAAKLANEPLIAVGNDFAQTDLEFDGVVGYWPRPASDQR
ncbi:type II toxin-antitoxin system VapC family toxin [Mycolicibacterium sp. 22603]|uniref:type II toxin-antitoxin system VapC family toxin n=1 Tax=Mycolicibacterium sp. 22603 TaxID=3453950 RepID=UPI003F835FE7